MKKRFLLAGGLGSIHIYNLVKNVLSYTDYEIVAYNTTGDIKTIPQNYLELYNKLNIKVVSGRNVGKVGKFKYIKGLYSDLKQLGKFNIINLHYVSHYIAPIIYLFRNNYGNIILTFWGSDLLRSNKIKRFFTNPILRRASCIQVMTSEMLESLATISGVRKYVSKTIVLDFGDLFLDGIDGIRKNTLLNSNAIKMEFGLDPKLPVVTIGYVGRTEMQQKKALENILTHSLINNYKFQLALPVYGMKTNQQSEIKSLLDDSGLPYRLYPDFMDEEKVVKFRSITDVFVHPQISDALSCSVVECFYSGSIVINGSWMRYDNLDKRGAYYYKFDTFSSLPYILEKVLSDINTEKEKSKVNIDIVKNMIHWDVLRPRWLKMYKDNE